MPSCMEDKEALLLDEAKQKELLKAVESGEAISPELPMLNLKILKAYFIVMKRIQSHKKLFRFFKYVMFGSKTEKSPRTPKIGVLNRLWRPPIMGTDCPFIDCNPCKRCSVSHSLIPSFGI